MATPRRFRVDVERFAKHARENMLAVQRQTVQEMAFRVVAGGSNAPGTPVDTGFARGSWIPSLNTPKVAGDKVKLDPSAANALSEIALMAAQMQIGDTFFYLNNCNYILNLEDGHSDQAPVGMVQIVVAQAPDIAQQVIDRLEYAR